MTSPDEARAALIEAMVVSFNHTRATWGVHPEATEYEHEIMGTALDALLGHREEILTALNMEQVGWVWTPHPEDADRSWCFTDMQFSKRWGTNTRPSNDAEPVFRRREAP